MASTSSNKQPMLVDRPATTSTLVTVASGQLFSTSLIPTAIGNATKVFDVDSALTDTSIGGAYIDEIFIRYSKETNIVIDARSPLSGTYSQSGTTVTITAANHNLKVGQVVYVDYTSGSGSLDEELTVAAVTPSAFIATASVSATTSGNVDIYDPIRYLFFIL